MADNTNPPPTTIDLRTPQADTAGQSVTQAAGQTGASTSGAASTGASDGTTSASADRFDIPEAVKNQFPDLIPLILKTESMNDDERQYWFQILPIMTEEQILKLREILANEQKQLAKLDKEYSQEVKKINDKHATEWKSFEAKEKREKLKATETKAKAAEQEEESQLLKKLQSL